MDAASTLERVRALDHARGDLERWLHIVNWWFRLAGLDSDLASILERRWGGFLSVAAPGAEPRLDVRILDGGDRRWIDPLGPGRTYEIAGASVEGTVLLASYHFAAALDGGRRWRLGVTRPCDEPEGRVVENALRLLVARVAIEDGGIAVHAAGVLREGRAHLFLGPSNSGKTTVTRLLQPCVSLGDDFGIVTPDRGGWAVAAVPFDNAESAPADAPAGLLRLEGLWRLFKSDRTRVDSPPDIARAASLVACAVAPWTMPDLSERLMDNAGRMVRAVPLGDLHFDLSRDLWDHLGPQPLRRGP